MLHAVAVDELTAVGHGIGRPEDVVVSDDGRVYASDMGSAVAELLGDGSLRRIGEAGGEPNGIDLRADGTMLVANFATGALQRLDLGTGAVTTVVDRVGDRPLTFVNYPLVGADGTTWVSCSTATDPMACVVSGIGDGYIFRLGPDGSTEIVAEGLRFANCMAFDDGGEHLYVVESAVSEVTRFRIEPDGSLSGRARYGPPVGERRPDEFGEAAAATMADPAVMARWGLADGCAFDAEGNLWVTLMAANRIVAITPGLEVVTVIDDPEHKLLQGPSSVAWGGDDLRDLYIGSLYASYVVKGRSPVAGRLRRGGLR